MMADNVKIRPMAPPEMPASYRALLTQAAERWGIDYIHEQHIPATEILCAPDRVTTIELFQFNGRWGFSLRIADYGGNGGMGYGSFLKFCDPYPDRDTALTAAVQYVVQRCSCEPRIVRWAQALRQPRLF